MGKLFIGGAEPSSLGTLDKLYVGDELVWPSVPAGSFISMTNALVQCSSGDSNNMTARLEFMEDGTNVPAAVNGASTITGVGPRWYTDTPPSNVSVRYTLVSNNGGVYNAFSLNPFQSLPQGSWFDMANTGGIQFNINGSGSSSYAWNADIKLEFSLDGGATIDSVSTFRVRVVKA